MKSHIGAQSYTFYQYCDSSVEKLDASLDDVFAQLVDAGLTAWEGYCNTPEQTDRLGGLLAKRKLEMPSIYAGAKLHTTEWQASVDDVLRRAALARPLGTRIIVCNPDPISWSEKLDKSDEELKRQAEGLRAIARGLASLDMQLAYHTHDPELRAGAREMHHMLLATRDAGVKFCLDANWVYRGAGNSNVALHDIVALYGDRVISLHLRQSHNGVWAELLEEGDVELAAVGATLKRLNFVGADYPGDLRPKRKRRGRCRRSRRTGSVASTWSGSSFKRRGSRGGAGTLCPGLKARPRARRPIDLLYAGTERTRAARVRT